MVFQSALNALNPVLRIEDQFADTAKAIGYLQCSAFRARVHDLLRMVRLYPERVWRSFPHELSGGMRQRVLIALGLLLEPQLLVLDEPTTALDILTQRNIMDVLKELRQRLDFSLIFISHDLSLAAELADRVATMYAGKIVETADVRTMFKSPVHPYTIGLINAVPTLAGTRGDLTSIPGSPPDLIDLPSGCPFHPRCPLADERSRAEEPQLVDVARGHQVACWQWQTSREALRAVVQRVTVLDEAITQIPARYRRDLLITVDGAGASHGLLDHITTLNASPWRTVHYSIGWELADRERTAIGRVPASAWDAVLDGDGGHGRSLLLNAQLVGSLALGRPDVFPPGRLLAWRTASRNRPRGSWARIASSAGSGRRSRRRSCTLAWISAT